MFYNSHNFFLYKLSGVVVAYRAVSLFSNCGAGDIGYRQAGFRFEVMAELDARRLRVCLLNHPEATGVEGDLRQTWPIVVQKYRQHAGDERPVLLAACPPCQGMSSAQSKRGLANDADAGSQDSRNLLVMIIAEVAKELQPDIVIIENVTQFLTRLVRHPITNVPISAAALIAELLYEQYEVFAIQTDLCDYGVPQTRKRSFLTFVRRTLAGCQFLLTNNRTPYPVPGYTGSNGQREPITIRDFLTQHNLPVLDSRSRETAIDSNDRLHCVPVWNGKNVRLYDMVEAIPIHTGRSGWDNSQCKKCGAVTTSKDSIYCSQCQQPLLRPLVRENDGKHRFVKGFRTSSYRRMTSSKPAATITTASGHIGSDNTIHPYEHRLMSVRECALLQTFPQEFRWETNGAEFSLEAIRAMIGEAVPPLFTFLHGQAIRAVLSLRETHILLPSSDERCIAARSKLNERIASPQFLNRISEQIELEGVGL